MTEAKRLSYATLGEARRGPAVRYPTKAAQGSTVGIVHFGLGAFYRALQSVYTGEAAAETGERQWGILGVTGRTDRVARQLHPQDGLYGVLVRGASKTRLQVVSAVRDVVWPGDAAERILDTIAAPTTHIITLTITEKGYHRAVSGSVDTGAPAILAAVRHLGEELSAGGPGPRRGDVAEGPAPVPIGLLARGLARRFRRGGSGITVLSCDNLSGNGVALEGVVASLVDAAAAGAGEHLAAFRAWLAKNVTFPSTMVDRITPATTARDRAQAEALTGLRDEGLVVTEPFSQWVIEDRFAGPRPRWELAGATVTDDVRPYERVKLRVLNAAHSMLAYLGALAGHETIAQAVADPRLHSIVADTLERDVLPTLHAPEGMNLEQYRDQVLERFANPSLPHTTLQVAMDGSQKLPIRMLETAAECLRAGRVPHGLATGVAAWIAFIAEAMTGRFMLDDPAAEALRSAVGSPEDARERPRQVVERVSLIPGIFADEVREPRFLTAVADALRPLIPATGAA